MKNYKAVYKILVLSLVCSGCLYSYNIHSVYANELTIENRRGTDYLTDSSGILKFLDVDKDYDKISYIKNNTPSSDIKFMDINGKKVEVLTKSLSIKMEDPTTDIMTVYNGELNIGIQNKPIHEVSISGVVQNRPGEMVAGNNGTINFFVDTMEASSARSSSHSHEAKYEMLFAIEPNSNNAKININASSLLKIKGNIGVGYFRNFIGWEDFFSGSRNGQVNINNLSTGTV